MVLSEYTDFRTILMDEAEAEAHEAGVNNLVFVQCFQDSPEESLWVMQTDKRIFLHNQFDQNIFYSCQHSRFTLVLKIPLIRNFVALWLAWI